MPFRLTRPHESLGDDSEPGYAEYGGKDEAVRKGPTPRLGPKAQGYAGSYGQHDFVASARRSDQRSAQRYRDSARDPKA
ncbi:MAG TPA: hypothetical protein VJP88_06030 [Caulobacteraceae bacterium]|nr:hypothetical protein [Caulobacteraceae bacterium]